MKSVARSAVGSWFLPSYFTSLSNTFPFCAFCLGRRIRDLWSRSATSLYQEDWKPPASGNDGASEGYTGWSRRDARGTSSSGHADNTEKRIPGKFSADCTGRTNKTTQVQLLRMGTEVWENSLVRETRRRRTSERMRWNVARTAQSSSCRFAALLLFLSFTQSKVMIGKV